LENQKKNKNFLKNILKSISKNLNKKFKIKIPKDMSFLIHKPNYYEYDQDMLDLFFKGIKIEKETIFIKNLKLDYVEKITGEDKIKIHKIEGIIKKHKLLENLEKLILIICYLNKI